MIVFPMLGKSSRFFNAGYLLPKYELPLGGETVFSKVVRSFECLFGTEHFSFIVRTDYGAHSFVKCEVEKMGIKSFEIREIGFETRGQAESVFLGINERDVDDRLIVFNIDTIRLNFSMPSEEMFGDGFLEVFEGVGDGWSFVEPSDGCRVKRTTEKVRISSLCSNGLYCFQRVGDFSEAYINALENPEIGAGEIYVAPLYNFLIKNGRDIRYRVVDPDLILHCGIPSDYECLKNKFINN